MPEDIYEHIREQAPFKFEFIDENDNYYKLDSYIKKLHDDYIVVTPPDDGDVDINIPGNAEVNLIFPLDNGILIAQCTVLGREAGMKPGVLLSFPHNTRVLERREYIRVPIKLRVEITFYSDQFYTDRKSFFAITKNISASGIAFYHREPIESCYDIGCKIYLSDENPRAVETRNKLIYSQKIKIKNETVFLTALSFTSISEGDSARIVKECFKYQVRHKKIKSY